MVIYRKVSGNLPDIFHPFATLAMSLTRLQTPVLPSQIQTICPLHSLNQDTSNTTPPPPRKESCQKQRKSHLTPQAP